MMRKNDALPMAVISLRYILCRKTIIYIVSELILVIGTSLLIKAIISSTGIDGVFIGLHGPFGRFVWTDGTAVDYQNWAAQNADGPTHSGYSDRGCTEFYGVATTFLERNFGIMQNYAGKWNDRPCGREYVRESNNAIQGFVCKI